MISFTRPWNCPQLSWKSLPEPQARAGAHRRWHASPHHCGLGEGRAAALAGRADGQRTSGPGAVRLGTASCARQRLRPCQPIARAARRARPGVPAASQVARRLAESGCRVIVPTLIDRTVAPRNGRSKLTSREFVYRSAFELGRHLIGYEVQKVLALVGLAVEGGRLGREGQDRRLRLRRGGRDRPLRRGPRPADRRRLRQRLFRGPQPRLDPADRPQRLRPARAVRRRRAGRDGRAPGPRRRGGAGPRVRLRGRAGGRPGQDRDPEPDDGQGRGRPGPRARRRAHAGPELELVASGPDGAGPFGTDEALGKLLAALRPGRSSRTPRPSSRCGSRASSRRKAWSPARPASSTRSTATTSSS